MKKKIKNEQIWSLHKIHCKQSNIHQLDIKKVFFFIFDSNCNAFLMEYMAPLALGYSQKGNKLKKKGF